MDNRINIDKAAHRVMDFHLNSELLCGMNGTFIDGDFVAFYHEERLYSVKNRKTGIVFLVYANSYSDAIRRVKTAWKEREENETDH